MGVPGARAKLSLLCVPPTPVTGESPPSLSKELTSTLAGVGDVSFDSDNQFPLDELKIDPLTLEAVLCWLETELIYFEERKNLLPLLESSLYLSWSKPRSNFKKSMTL